MKIAVVGGGSTYTPELIDGFARLRSSLPVSELVLTDPDGQRLELVGGLAQRIFARYGHPGRIWTTTDLDAAVDGADAVLLQLRVGGQAARQRDESWPLECGCVGQETTGAGGLAKALRTVPVVLDIAERVRRANPDAWVIDFTNPVGIVTRALLQEGHKAVGLCNVAIGLQRKFAHRLGVRPEELQLAHYGLNHLTWEFGVHLVNPDGGSRESDAGSVGAWSGTDVLPALLSEHGEALAADLRLPKPLLDRLGLIPSYYLRYFYSHDQVVEQMREKPSRAAEVAAMEAELLRMYADPTLAEKPALLAKRGGAYYSEAAVALAAGLLGTAPRDFAEAEPGSWVPSVQVVNLRNEGTLPFLPDDAVVEVPARVSAEGVTALPAPAIDPLYAGLMSSVTAYENLALDAALHGGRDRVFAALLSHPLIGQYDHAEALTDRLLAHNKEHLAWL